MLILRIKIVINIYLINIFGYTFRSTFLLIINIKQLEFTQFLIDKVPIVILNFAYIYPRNTYLGIDIIGSTVNIITSKISSISV